MDRATDTPLPQDAPFAAVTRGLLQNDAAMQGLAELISKLEPLLAGRRLNHIVDLLSAAADMVDMSDAYMVEKLSQAFEDSVGAAWSAGNAARLAAARLEKMEDTPTLLGLVRMANEPDVRRGLAFVLSMAAALGRQHAYDPIDHSAD
ncbi:MAG: DUF1641 domain-containing protein [Comamonas sp.]